MREPTGAEIEGVADRLVTAERAEHGLPACRFDMLADKDQATYRARARAAIIALDEVRGR